MHLSVAQEYTINSVKSGDVLILCLFLSRCNVGDTNWLLLKHNNITYLLVSCKKYLCSCTEYLPFFLN